MLKLVEPTESALANQIAQRIVAEIAQVAGRVAKLRASGVPAVAAKAAQALPDGRVIPARPAVPAVTAEAIDAALGKENCALLDQIKAALGI